MSDTVGYWRMTTFYRAWRYFFVSVIFWWRHNMYFTDQSFFVTSSLFKDPLSCPPKTTDTLTLCGGTQDNLCSLDDLTLFGGTQDRTSLKWGFFFSPRGSGVCRFREAKGAFFWVNSFYYSSPLSFGFSRNQKNWWFNKNFRFQANVQGWKNNRKFVNT